MRERRGRRAATVALAAALALAGSGCGRSDPGGTPAQDVPEYSVEQFLGTTDFRGASFSPDNDAVLVSSDASGVYNAVAIPTDGGEPVPLTVSTTESILALAYFPSDRRLLYSSDRGGNELTHVWVRETDGTARDLTPGDGLKAEFLGFAADDASFFLATNQRDPRFFDIYEYDADDYERRMIYRDDTGLQFGAISPDERYIAFTRVRTTSDSDVWLHDRRTGATENLTAHEGLGNVSNSPQDFSADGGALYLTTDQDAEFAYLVRLDLPSGERREVLRPEWDVSYARVSKRGTYIVAGINNDARTEIRVLETESLRPVELPEVPGAEISSVIVSDDETMLAFYVSSSTRPRDLYVQKLGGEPRVLTRSLNRDIDPAHLVEGRVVRFTSYDDVEIPGILYQPHRASPGRPVPALVWVHGGPGGQSRVGYDALIQYLANHGYAVFAINNRGSSGYGKTFHAMDDRRHGEADLGDCVASKRMLVNTGWVEPGRIGIIGGSYGGYMVLAALTLEPREFAVGVDIFGVANWPRTLESIPPYWESFREALYAEMGDPQEDADRLRRISPVFNADRIAKPLMVLQGANDPRVLKAESDDIVAAARNNGAVVEYVVFDDEGHGFRKKDNRIEGYRAIRQFLDQHLRGDPPEPGERTVQG